LRDSLKNEIKQTGFNRIREIYLPAEIVVEEVDFRNLNLSKG